MFVCLQIAYKTASNRFQGKLSEIFLVLSDDYASQQRTEEGAEASGFQQVGRGQKHRLDEDQMSVHSVESKRLDTVPSAEKNRKNKSKSKSKGRH